MAKTKKAIVAELKKLGVEADEKDTLKSLAKLLKEAKVAKKKAEEAEKAGEDKGPEEGAEKEGNVGEGKGPDKPEEEPAEVAEMKDSKYKALDIKGPIDIFDRHGVFVRTYSEETYGKKYRVMAAEFIMKGNKKANADTVRNPVPFINRQREARPHDFKIKSVDVVDSREFVRATFTREEYGIHFIERAKASFNSVYGLPDTGSPNKNTHKPDRLVKCRLEFRK